MMLYSWSISNSLHVNFLFCTCMVAGAVEVLRLVGFSDGVQSENCLVLKSSDPGLLWLARASLEASLA